MSDAGIVIKTIAKIIGLKRTNTLIKAMKQHGALIAGSVLISGHLGFESESVDVYVPGRYWKFPDDMKMEDVIDKKITQSGVIYAGCKNNKSICVRCFDHCLRPCCSTEELAKYIMDTAPFDFLKAYFDGKNVIRKYPLPKSRIARYDIIDNSRKQMPYLAEDEINHDGRWRPITEPILNSYKCRGFDVINDTRINLIKSVIKINIELTVHINYDAVCMITTSYLTDINNQIECYK